MEKNIIEINLPKSDKQFGTIEAYKNLRTNLVYTENLQVIMITSTVADEGKTVSAFNLAESFAEAGKKVLLIDCDLRGSFLNKFLIVKEKVAGISEILTNQAIDVINKTNIKNLDIILSGKVPPNPSELLSSNLFKLLIKSLKEKYDYIIIDTPPVTVATDAVVVGRIVDGVVLVVRNDFVKRNSVQRAKMELERNGARIIGVVLNRVNKDQVDYKDYAYNYY
ncbi:CpsD/CapB family tyrosine-protein kinase [uncultured Clostridium sp.]|uniref:CpsD/CapB family tyrosine-protein kinase n=1 Tax=uncultured Clostridium sp. TaxID=59620 RepID=UPI00259A447D|nr:CpsD/CapB family tyrosine-protein kinase [uncultured Clostridium sp.]